MLHDPSVYSDPDTFNPDRFSPTDKKPEGEPDPARAAFGFGRRCAFMYLHASPRASV